MNGETKFNANRMVMRETGLTMQEDMFCIFFVEYGDEEKAFARAFDGEPYDKDKVYNLLSNAVLLQRVNTLYNRRLTLLETDATVEVKRLYQELEAARVMAMENKQPSAAVSATMAKAKIAGLIVDKQQITVKKVNELTDEELKFLLEGEYQDVTPAQPKEIANGPI